ncbi:hypothetical protein E2C01_040921 [Portunus trituberculatus]|uniref:Uncharacterized protein n=1 Tax=Portunus trituberculatus TaxID=210409 RepID=A0A5B7FS36_PORTR|nr:hypothetical protein [Portunus trituberculatus]
MGIGEGGGRRKGEKEEQGEGICICAGDLFPNNKVMNTCTALVGILERQIPSHRRPTPLPHSPVCFKRSCRRDYVALALAGSVHAFTILLRL